MALSRWLVRCKGAQLRRQLGEFRTAYARYVTNLADESIDTARYEAHLATLSPSDIATVERVMSATEDLNVLLDPQSNLPEITAALARLAPLIGEPADASPSSVLSVLAEVVTDVTPGLWEPY